MAKLMHQNVSGERILWLESKSWGFTLKRTNASLFLTVLPKSPYLNTGVLKISPSIFQLFGLGHFPPHSAAHESF